MSENVRLVLFPLISHDPMSDVGLVCIPLYAFITLFCTRRGIDIQIRCFALCLASVRSHVTFSLTAQGNMVLTAFWPNILGAVDASDDSPSATLICTPPAAVL